MIICFANDTNHEQIKIHLDNLDKKVKKELFGKETIHTIMVYKKDYTLKPIIFNGNETEAIKHWGKGKQFLYKVG